MGIIDKICNFIVNYEDKDNRIKVLDALIAVAGFILSTILEIMYLKYLDKTYGDSDSGLWGVYTFLQLIVLTVMFGTSISQIKELQGTGCIVPILVIIISAAIIIAKINFVKSQIKDFEAQALSNSYYTTGIITKQDLSVHKSSTTYYLWAGRNDSLAKSHTVNKQIYNKKNVGDTVILQVSKEYPRINQVHNWNPDSSQIAKYRDGNY